MTDTVQSVQEYTDEQAIAAALTRNWKLAIEINTKLLIKRADNIDIMNRLGFAYGQTGNIKEAKRVFSKVTSIDPYNQIAIKNLKKLALITSDNIAESLCNTSVSPLLFLEDPGKTKIVQCVNIAPTQTLSHIHCGQEVFLRPRNHCVEIRDEKNRYLGALPDDLSFRLIKFLEGNNQYSVFVKTIDKNVLSVFIREISRGKKFESQPSFITPITYASYARDITQETDKPDTTATGEDETEPKEDTQAEE